MQLPQKQKVVFLGDQSVGKTSILQRYINDNFDDGSRPTIGIDFITKAVQIEERVIKLQLWDTAGQERFRSLIPSYLRDCNVAVIVYDITNKNTFNNVKKWYDEVREIKGKDVFILVVANKIDIPQQQWQVTQQEGIELSQLMDSIYFEVSAKDNTNVVELFTGIATNTLSLIENTSLINSLSLQTINTRNEIQIESQKQVPIKLNSNNQQPKQKKCC